MLTYFEQEITSPTLHMQYFPPWIHVIFFNSPGMPGGGGTSNVPSTRTVGLTPLFHSFEMYEMSEGMASEWLKKFPWDNIPPNPNVHTVMRHRATTWNVIRQNRVMYNAAHKIGLILVHFHT